MMKRIKFRSSASNRMYRREVGSGVLKARFWVFDFELAGRAGSDILDRWFGTYREVWDLRIELLSELIKREYEI